MITQASTFDEFVCDFCLIDKASICSLSEVEALFPPVDVVEDDVAGAGSQIVGDIGLKVKSFEFWFDIFAHLVPMSGNRSAPRVGHRVDRKLHFVDVLEERLLEGSLQVLIPDFLPHPNSIIYHY